MAMQGHTKIVPRVERARIQEVQHGAAYQKESRYHVPYPRVPTSHASRNQPETGCATTKAAPRGTARQALLSGGKIACVTSLDASWRASALAIATPSQEAATIATTIAA